MAVRFDSSADALERADLSAAVPWTVTGWGKVTVDRNAVSTFLSWATAVNSSDVAFRTGSDGVSLSLWEDAAAASTDTNIDAVVGTWFYWALSIDGSGNWVLYVTDSVEGAITTASGTLLGTTFDTFVLGNNGSEWLNGCVDNVIVYDSVLSAADVELQRHSRLPIRTPWAWYPMNGGSLADAQKDYSGNGRDWTAASTPSFEDGAPIPWNGESESFIPFTPASDPGAEGGGGLLVGSSAAYIGQAYVGATESSDVSLALTGIAATASPGTVSPAIDKALTGEVATASPGNIATASPTAGEVATSATGTVTPSTDKAITGEVATSATGTVAPEISASLTGIAATASPGSVSPSADVALTGEPATATPGTVTPSADVAITGETSTASPGTVGPGLEAVGVQGTSSTGSVTASTSVALTGEQVVASPGTVGTAAGPATGEVATSTAGSVSPGSSLATTGEVATTGHGTVTPSLEVPITGASAPTSPGTLSPSTDKAIAGEVATVGIGSVAPGMEQSPTGEQAVGSPGTVGVQITVSLTGEQATAEAGDVGASVPGGASISGVDAPAQAGNVGPQSSVAITGEGSVASPGTMVPVTFPTGVEAASAAGAVAPGSSLATTGEAVTTSTGTLGVQVSVALTGSEMVATPGQVSTPGGSSATGSEATATAGNVGVNITVALTGIGGVAQTGTVSPLVEISILGSAVAGSIGDVSPRFSILLSGSGINVVAGNITGPVHLPPQVVLGIALNEAMMSPPSSQNAYTAGRKIARVYCDWAQSCSSQLGAYPTGLTSTGYLELAKDLGRVLALSGGFVNVSAREFAHSFTSMWKTGGVIFGSEPVVSCTGTNDLARAMVFGWDPFLLRRAGAGESMPAAWFVIAQALYEYTQTIRTASGLINPPT